MSNLPSKENYKESISYQTLGYSKPLYKCEKCGGGMRRYEGMVLTSYPVQYRYTCEKCGYNETW